MTRQQQRERAARLKLRRALRDALDQYATDVGCTGGLWAGVGWDVDDDFEDETDPADRTPSVTVQVYAVAGGQQWTTDLTLDLDEETQP